jgi:hypothetical protein
VAPFWLVQREDKQGGVVFSGLFFFGYFLLEEQKEVTINQKRKEALFKRVLI